jgi:hypothetical protein
MEKAAKRQQREALKRQKELARRLKEQAKLSALEQARLEVEAHENALEVLLSVHKEQSPPFDWAGFAAALPPHEPPRLARHELAALLRRAAAVAVPFVEDGKATPEEARLLDEREHEASRAEYEKDFAEWARMRALARRVLTGEERAYAEAVAEFSTLSEIANLGSSIGMSLRGAKLIECALKVSGREAIPAEVKSLTAAGKVSVKAMPKARFHEIYQDYVCGCVLRLTREVFALLPVETVLVTATVDGIDARTGHAAELPVLSVAIPRAVAARLDFERLDPSDSLENFLHRGDVTASRKSGEFVEIVPLTPSDLAQTQPENMGLSPLVARLRQFRIELSAILKPAITGAGESTDPNTPTA